MSCDAVCLLISNKVLQPNKFVRIYIYTKIFFSDFSSLPLQILTCPMQLRLPKVLQAWLKSSSSQRGKDEPVPPMQSKLSRLRLLENSLRDGRQLKRGVKGKGRHNKGDVLRIFNIKNERQWWRACAHIWGEDGELILICDDREAKGKRGWRENLYSQQNDERELKSEWEHYSSFLFRLWVILNLHSNGFISIDPFQQWSVWHLSMQSQWCQVTHVQSALCHPGAKHKEQSEL